MDHERSGLILFCYCFWCAHFHPSPGSESFRLQDDVFLAFEVMLRRLFQTCFVGRLSLLVHNDNGFDNMNKFFRLRGVLN